MPSWVPFASLAMGLVAYFAAKLVERWLEVRQTPQTMAEWLPVLEPIVLRVVHKSRELAEAVAEWNVARHRVPVEYHRVVDSVIRYAQLCEEQLHQEMVDGGGVPLHTVIPYETAVMKPITIQPPPPIDDLVFEETNISFPSDRDWIGGQLIKRSGTS